MSLWNYEEQFPGASGGSAVRAIEHFPATWRQMYKPFEVDGADIHRARRRIQSAPGAGQAASARPEAIGVIYNDYIQNTREAYSMDGWEGSQAARHPDGRFVQNTLGGSNSLLANFDRWNAGNRRPVGFGETGMDTAPIRAGAYSDADPFQAQEHLYNPSGPSGTTSYSGLNTDRATRLQAIGLNAQSESLLVTKPRDTNFLNGEWDARHVAGVGAVLAAMVAF